MAFEEHQIELAREEAEKSFSEDEIEAARKLLDAFTFHLLDIFAKSVASSMKYYSDRSKKINKTMGALDYTIKGD